MSDYTITIVATGIHLTGHPDDADRLAAKAVQDLEAAGHVVHHAIMTHGAHHHIPLKPKG